MLNLIMFWTRFFVGSELNSYNVILEVQSIFSDVPILGLRPRTARTEGFLGGPRPHKDRSSKTERPAVFFGP